MLDKIKTRTITASGAAVLLISLMIYVFSFAGVFSLIFSFRILGLTAAYLALALLSPDFRGISEMFYETWTILKFDIPAKEKMDMIKTFLEATCAEWEKYWCLYQEIVNGGCIKPKQKYKLIYYYIKRMSKGEINLTQITWIYFYVCYSLLLSANYFFIPVPVDIIVSIGVLILILLSSGGIIGLTKFITEIFKLLDYEDEESIEKILRGLEVYIKRGAKKFYYITIIENEMKKNE